jgi:hypothetical protein
LIDLMASQHPQARQIGTVLEQQEANATERTANREFLKTEKGLDRENRLATAQGQMGQNIVLATMAGASKETIQAMKDSNDKLIQEMRGKSAEKVATIGADAKVDAAGMKAGAGKALPGSIGGKFMENSQNLRMAERAKALIEGQTVEGAKGDPNATGMKGYLPDMLTQRMDPSGVETRAAVANLGSMIIHDRSGAAVTASEYPRLKPFIPAATDDPATVKKKLGQFIHEYNKINDEMTQFYTESGYNVPSSDWHKSPETTVPTTQGKPNAFQPFHDPDEEKAYQQWKLEHK